MMEQPGRVLWHGDGDGKWDKELYKTARSTGTRLMDLQPRKDREQGAVEDFEKD